VSITRRCFIWGGLSVAAMAQKARVQDGASTEWQSVGYGVWTAQDGEITGRFDKNRPGPGYLLTRETFSDFRLAVEFSISRGGKSGIYLREPQRKWSTEGDNRPGCGPESGCEVLINYQDPENPTGSICNVQKAKKLVGAEETWTELEIVCKGASIRVSVAGQNVNRFNQLRVAPGVIGFEIPTAAPEGFVVRFRHIVISPVA
jgi:hypothetical protein